MAEHVALPAFSSWAGPRNPKLLIIGEAWGEQEAMTRQPFVGASGCELWRMLGEAIPVAGEEHLAAIKSFRYGNAWIRQREGWLTGTSIAFTNVFNLRPVGNKIESLCETKKENKHVRPSDQIARGFYLRSEYLLELARLSDEISQASPNLIVAAGNTACWATLRATNIGGIRGACTIGCKKEEGGASPGRKILPTYHPAGVLRNWSWRTVVVADLIKAWRESQYPELVRPERQVQINPGLPDIATWLAGLVSRPPPYLAVDIETAGGQITCIGFARSRSDALVIPFMDLRLTEGSYWSRRDELVAWQYIRDILALPVKKLFQNGSYDLQYIMKMGFTVVGAEHDTMLLHHSLFPELQKGLGFLGSIYTGEQSWKLMRRRKADTEKKDE